MKLQKFHKMSEDTFQKMMSLNECQMRAEIDEKVSALNEWLQQMEGKLLPLKIHSRWTKKAIEEKTEEVKAVHLDIESHAPLIKTLVQLCQKYSETFLRINRKKRKKRKQEETDPANKSPPGAIPTQSSPKVIVGQVIEQRWHQLWLRSLEWQCFLEQLAWKTKRLNKGTSRTSTASAAPPKSTSASSQTSVAGAKRLLFLRRRHIVKMNSSYSSESSSSLLTESTSSNAISSCCDHAIEEIDEDSWNSHKSCQSSSQMLRPSSMIESSRKCKTMFTRTTGTSDVKPFGQTFPNCGTYFFKHISDGEEDDGELVGKVQELEPDANCNNVMVIPSIPSDTFEEDEINQNQITSYNNSTKEIDSLSPRSDEPASIEQLVMDVEELVILRRPSKVHRFPSYLNCDALNKTVKSNESDDHDNVYDDEGMDCRRDDPRRSMHSSSSLSILMDCLINQPESIEHGYGPVTSTDNESEDEAKRQTKKVMLVKRRRHVLNDDVDESSCLTDEDFHLSEEDHEEDEELSEYWDQEKYLSEHNYDEPIDEDSTLKLLNFGDDYSKFIDSMSEGDLSDHRHPSLTVGLGPVQSASTPNTKQRLKRRLRRSTTVREVVYDSVSESELDDAWRVALHSRTKLNEVKQRFKNIQDEEDLLDVNLVAANREELTSLKDLCFENVECILKLLEENPQNSNTIILKKTKRSFKGLLRHWQEILHMIVKRLQLSENLSRLILDIQTLETSLSDVSKMDYLTTSNQMVIHNKQDLEKDIQELKSSIVDLTKLKSDLFTVNLEIHNFLADFYSSGRKDPHRIPSLVKRDLSPSASLKEKVVTLYAMWDNTFHKVSSQLVNAESTLSKLIEFEVEKERLVRLKEESINNATNIKRQYFRKKNSLSLTEDSGISESGDNDSEETILIKLRRLAQDLETKLTPDSHLIKEIAESLKNSSHNVSSTIFEEPKPKPFSESHKKKNHKRRKSNKSRKCCDDTTSTWSYFWRVICASLPFHLILMAAVFMAWSYHPKCCEASNGMLLLPQLRYINGPPPI